MASPPWGSSSTIEKGGRAWHRHPFEWRLLSQKRATHQAGPASGVVRGDYWAFNQLAEREEQAADPHADHFATVVGRAHEVGERISLDGRGVRGGANRGIGQSLTPERRFGAPRADRSRRGASQR